jgi:hypothetical protein
MNTASHEQLLSILADEHSSTATQSLEEDVLLLAYKTEQT